MAMPRPSMSRCRATASVGCAAHSRCRAIACARWCSPRSRRFRAECQVLIVANPRTTFLPAESAGIEAYLRGGGSLLAMFDLGFVLEQSPRRRSSGSSASAFRRRRSSTRSATTPRDSEMVAVTGYEAGPVTRNLSMTFFPGVRPLAPRTAGRGLMITPLFASSRDSYTRPVLAGGRARRRPGAASRAAPAPSGPGPRLLAVTAEGRLPGARCRRAAAARRDRRRRRFRQQLVPSVSRQQRSRALDGPLAGARGAHDERCLERSRCRR